MTLTFIDTGVLIAADRGEGEQGQRALDLLDEPAQRFASSDFVRLEVLPKPVFFRQRDEVEFCETFFNAVAVLVKGDAQLIEVAYQEATSLGLNALDALHIAAARRAGAEEFITTEGLTKPLHRATGIRIVSISEG